MKRERAHTDLPESTHSFPTRRTSDLIKTGNKEEIIDKLDYPISAIIPINYQYAFNCDSLKFIDQKKLYSSLEISKDNVDVYFDLIFGSILKEIITQITVTDLLNESSFFSDIEQLNYNLYNKENLEFKCKTKEYIFITLKLDNDKWLIGLT